MLDTLEGLTDLHEMIATVVLSQLEDLSLAGALRERIGDMQERLVRFEDRAEKKRHIVLSVLERAGIKKLIKPEFTVSLRQTPRPLVVIDEKEIPPELWVFQPAKLDRRRLADALKSGRAVAGATLGNGGLTLSMRTK